jgi:hypothetical protein
MIKKPFRVQRFRGSKVKNPEALNCGTLVLSFIKTNVDDLVKSLRLARIVIPANQTVS